jgi:predicted NBD/HSP70 family sugar kinase
MVRAVREATAGWDYDRVSLGIPAVVWGNEVVGEPPNLGPGWVRFDFQAAFERPVRVLNDAAMQALGSYEGGGTMLFLGFGTGMGSALVAEGRVLPLELGHLPYRGRIVEHFVGHAGLARLGVGRWRRYVLDVVEMLRAALLPDEVVLGGANAAKHLDPPPPGCRLGDNALAFTGGMRMWEARP